MFTNSLFFGAAISLLAYEVGLLLRKKFKKAIFNPLLIGILCVIGVLSIFHIEYDSYNVGGQYISYLLTPATVCLAVPLYEQLSLLKKNLVAVAAGIVSGVLASMVSVLPVSYTHLDVYKRQHPAYLSPYLLPFLSPCR